MSPLAGRLSEDELQRLDAEVESALDQADESRLLVLGGGEISLVLGWPPADPAFACKRLPVFPTRDRFDAYRRTLLDYLDALRERGVDVVETELSPIEREDGTVAGYAVQPVLPAKTLAPAVLAAGDAGGRAPYGRCGRGDRLCGDRAPAGNRCAALQLDLGEGAPPLPRRHDPDDLGGGREPPARPRPSCSRPFLRSRAGQSGVSWRRGILDGYRHRRGVANDLLGNLIKERLNAWIPAFLEPVNRSLDPPISEQAVRSYYRSDARLWEWLLRIRRLDRAWQRHVRRRPYRFLLPHRVAR